MFLPKLLLSLTLLLPAAVMAQNEISEKKPVTINGIEYGYIVKNEQTKSAKGEDYSRYEITLYATNKTGCTRLYANNTGLLYSDNSNLLVTFDCTNANGKRLTAKSGTVRARDFYVSTKVKPEGKDTKEVTQSVKVGYIFRNGESLRSNIIVLVPLGQSPVLTFMPNSPAEL
jgi:hypothetical protein